MTYDPTLFLHYDAETVHHFVTIGVMSLTDFLAWAQEQKDDAWGSGYDVADWRAADYGSLK